jgi:voltage-gated sodium channel
LLLCGSHLGYHPHHADRQGDIVIARLRTIVEDPRTERMVMAFIIVNAVILGLETSKTVMASFGPLLAILDHIILGVFVVELTARIMVHRWAFFRDPWSVFDFLVVGIALVPATETFSVLRALRVLRVLRLITAVPSLKRVVAGLLAALPGMGSIVLLIGLIYYVFAVMATKLFGDDNPNLFGTLGDSLFTLFTVMTLEGWTNDVAKPVMEHHPHGWLFFVIFIVVTTFMVLNLFIGVVVNAMQAEAIKAEAGEREAEREMIQEEAAPILTEVKNLRKEVAALRMELAGRAGSA